MVELRPAGLVPRFGAFAIDSMIRGAIYMMLATALGTLGKLGFGLFLLALFLIEWFYPVIFELSLSGATPGKRAMGIAVVEQNGLPVSIGASITRNLLRFVDFLPFGYGAAIVSIILTKDFRRLGDLAAGTVVVYQSTKHTARKLPDAAAVAVLRPMDADTQLALIGLAERSRYLTPERTLELVRIADQFLAPTEAGDTDSAAQARVFGTAHWLLGERESGGA